MNNDNDIKHAHAKVYVDDDPIPQQASTRGRCHCQIRVVGGAAVIMLQLRILLHPRLIGVADSRCAARTIGSFC